MPTGEAIFDPILGNKPPDFDFQDRGGAGPCTPAARLAVLVGHPSEPGPYVIRVIRGRVFDDGDLIAELSGEAYRCLHTRVRDESDDDELMNAVPGELEVQS